MSQRKHWKRWGILLGVIMAGGLVWKSLAPHKAIAMSDVVKVELRPKAAQHVQELNPTEA